MPQEKKRLMRRLNCSTENFTAKKLIFAAGLSLLCSLSAAQDENSGESSPVRDSIQDLMAEYQETVDSYTRFEIPFPPGTSIRAIREKEESIEVVFNSRLTFRPLFEQDETVIQEALEEAIGAEVLNGRKLVVKIGYGSDDDMREYALSSHITSADKIKEREAGKKDIIPSLTNPVVSRIDSAAPAPSNGLFGKNIVLMPSHGWTWHKENRWQYQRARVYTIIEDLFTQSYMNPFIGPMLENAGAVTWNVRERDYQTGEVIVDNDGTTRHSTFETTGNWSSDESGGWNGGRKAAYGPLDEPFSEGTTLYTAAGEDATAVYTPYVPHQGDYAVYMTWKPNEQNSDSVRVTVKHQGGSTDFRVNQKVAGKTWVFLGFFYFEQGADTESGSVTVHASDAVQNENGPTRVSVDAVRLGGGMGNIAPMDQVSQKPRYAEGARYYLQYAGAPADTVYYLDFNNEHFGIDYWRDIAGRAEWANYLQGAPAGPNEDRDQPGLGVPIDMVFGFHTDAGFDEEGLIGTLTIWRLFDSIGEDIFPDGRSRFLNRDLSVLMHSEINRTGRALYSSDFVQRFVWERNLGEIRRPNVPSTLLELVSHHNFNDMKYGTDPRFKFDMSRAIYKSFLKFLAYSNGYEPVVQPLPPHKLVVQGLGEGKVQVSWQETLDPLEPSAKPDGYVLYTSLDGKSFDNGRYYEDTTSIIHEETFPAGESVYFKVTAVNSGGESFPTPVAGFAWREGASSVLIVDGFDRICGPAIVHKERTHGFDRDTDPGVGYMYNYALVGDQYDFDPKSPWANDLETPGMGGSESMHDEVLEMGNTFDHIVRHGETLLEAGYPFDSMTADAFADSRTINNYEAIDWIAGLQRTTMPFEGDVEVGKPDMMDPEFQVFTPENQAALDGYLNSGGRIIVSGSYVLEDLIDGPLADNESRAFALNTFGSKMYAPKATTINHVVPSDFHPAFEETAPFRFGRDLERPVNILPTVYKVHAPEAMILGEGQQTLMMYGDTQLPAAVTNGKSVLFGFPLESVQPAERRVDLLKNSLSILMNGE